jgi:malto-oligosyltrehalose synthase/4-alpha-glucanotransferase
MYNPVATYRIQFCKEFSFGDFEKVIPYLQKLGVSTIYASPVFESVSGSAHGYDVLNAHRINPGIGDKEQMETIIRHLQQNKVGWLQDIVPNHMAYHPGNEWLMDVLEKGKHSIYASFFDIIWNSEVHNGRLMVPFLGSNLEEAINNEEIKLKIDDHRIFLCYYENKYPLHPNSYSIIFHQKKRLTAAIKQITKNIAALDLIEDAKVYSDKWNAIKASLHNETIKKAIQSSIEAINNNKELLTQIAGEQVYQLCHWQETDHQINYRRFFTINGLICLNMHDQNIFEHYHQLIHHFLEKGIYNGLRVDHIDGLFDPSAYLDRLRELSGDETYIVVEKILTSGESLLHQWNIEGNTGYDFLTLANNVFTNKKNEVVFIEFYRQLTNDKKSVHQHLYEKKSDIIFNYMAGELDNLYRLSLRLKLADVRDQSSIHPEDLKNAIAEFLIRCPVYRYYGNQFPLSEPEVFDVQHILNKIRKAGAADENAITVLEKVLVHKPHDGDGDYNKRVSQFYQRCMQFTGPLMAKGVEDTLMYTFNRFIAHNEVGDSPEAFGISIDEFHNAMIERQGYWPLSLNATSTHDTKRGEDVRARLNVISDIPDDWFDAVQNWQQLTQIHKQNNFPDANDEYLVYQSLAGNYPMPGQDEDHFEERFTAYLQKALREAKRYSNWATPNEEYENASLHFARKLLNKNEPFWKSFEQFYSQIIDFGIINSLSQVVLKFTCPGVPDLYQGCELWDFSFVDPDNRAPVDYEKRNQWLNELVQNETNENFWQQLWNERYNGKIKLWLVHQLLKWRKEQKEFLTHAEYLPLQADGAYKENVLAFARKYKQTAYIIIVPIHLAELSKRQGKNLKEIDWKDTGIAFPGRLVGQIQNVLTEKTFEKKIRLKELFAELPIALLKTQLEEQQRGAGILLHITSLSSPFGIGDLGHEAKLFAGFLYRSKQQYWQLLPINPTEAGQGHSPYSAISSMAGNSLLVSPELLAKEKLLDAEELNSLYLPGEAKTDYVRAEEIKTDLLDQAYQNFVSGNFRDLKNEFMRFCLTEEDWLDDFALYAVLKKQNGGKPWYEWDDEFKQRATGSLKKFSEDEKESIEKAKWIQFIFFRQWKELKEYCNNMNIQLIGDIPFYVSYDSADVWANKEIFALDENDNRIAMAGVPPDAFSDEGQLWGMPVFKWEVLKQRNYDWWIRRLKKNAELFDIVRLDHFRAFDEYWEVPAGETTAQKGEWKPGPGNDFFETVKKELGELPFIAEDLGEITPTVYRVRDAFHLPGMKVLQFAFGSDMPLSTHIPHHYQQNFIAYTGTHDNNTTVGWYRTEASDETKKRLFQYLGKDGNENEIHKEMARLAYASVAKIAILPLQDILGLDENSRMNKPSSTENNWAWRLTPGQLGLEAENWLKELTAIYDRSH